MIMCTKRKLIVGSVIALMLCLLLPLTVYAHGASIEYTVDMTVEIYATYDSGEPMAGAQVIVYAPDNPTTPWLTGVCDDEGRFSFTPDTTSTGTWDVQVRLAGHGGMIHIPVGEGTVGTGGTGGYSVAQIVVMAVCVIWGIAGTALYFMRKRA